MKETYNKHKLNIKLNMKPELEEIEKDILILMLDFIPRNQNQITVSIGKDPEKSKDRVQVSRILKTEFNKYLVRCLPKGFDESGKIWVLREDIEIIRQIVEKHDSILYEVPKSKKILSMIVRKQYWFIDYKNMRTEYEKRHGSYEQEPRCGSYLFGQDEESMKYYAKMQNDLEIEFEDRLKMSPYFCRQCLINTPEELKEKFGRIFSYTLESFIAKHPYDILTTGNMDEEFTRAFCDKIFEICVFYDILNNEVSEEAENHITERNYRQYRIIEELEYEDMVHPSSIYEDIEGRKGKKSPGERTEHTAGEPEGSANGHLNIKNNPRRNIQFTDGSFHLT